MVSIAFPLLAVISPFTFSATNAFGFFASTNSAKCLKSPPRVPFNPGCFQIIEKSWQGKPPRTRSHSGIDLSVYGLIFVISLSFPQMQ